MKVFITKYALTKGIFEKEAEVCTGISDDFIRVNDACGYHSGEYYNGDDWHTTKEDAIQKAEDMQQKKIIALNKQIIKLSKLKFR